MQINREGVGKGRRGVHSATADNCLINRNSICHCLTDWLSDLLDLIISMASVGRAKRAETRQETKRDAERELDLKSNAVICN